MPRVPDPIHLLSAGSLRHALPAIIAEFTDAGSAPVALTLGPAGLLRERIEAGEAFDLFISADMGHPRRLARLSIAEAPVRLVRNRLCALARADLRLTQADFLGILSDPAIRIGTSTPGADPCGDYAARMFDMIEAHHPGIGAGMRARAQHLLGGRDSPAGKDGASLIADGAVDVFLGYFTSARFHADDPAFGIAEIPAEWSPRVEYGLAMRPDAGTAVTKFRDFLLSPPARERFRDAGFDP